MSNIPFIQGLSVSGDSTLTIPSGTSLILVINTNINYSSIPSNILNNAIGINISSGYTLTIDVNTTLPSNIANISGSGTLSINSGVTLTIGANTTFTVSTVSGAGTLSISSGITLTINANTTFSIATVSGNGTLSISSGYTLTINANTTITTPQITGSGILQINSGYTLSVGNQNQQVYAHIPQITGGGALQINNTLYIYANATFSVPTVLNSASFAIASGYTLTQGSDLTIEGGTIMVYGTWANAGYNITIPSGTTVTWTVPGSITTASTPGTLTVNGLCVWQGNGVTAQNSNAVPIFLLNLVGTGMFIGSPTNTYGNASQHISLSSTAINANAGDGSATGSGKVPYLLLNSITGSATGKYGLGIYDSTANSYVIFGLIYIGTTTFNLPYSQYINYTSADTSGDTIQVWNAYGSAGTLTLTGYAYV